MERQSMISCGNKHEVWSGREDLNPRFPAPKAGGLRTCLRPDIARPSRSRTRDLRTMNSLLEPAERIALLNGAGHEIRTFPALGGVSISMMDQWRPGPASSSGLFRMRPAGRRDP